MNKELSKNPLKPEAVNPFMIGASPAKEEKAVSSQPR